jgi:hypothetical protein
MGIMSYKFPITNFHSVWLFFAGADIYRCSGNRSAFQAVIVGTFLSAGHRLAVMKVIAFQAKVRR